MPRAPRAEIVSKETPIPPGTKRVRSTRIEVFDAPLAEDPADAQPPSTNELPDPIEPESIDDDDPGELIDDEPLSPVDELLRSIEKSSDLTLYVIRLPDPVGMNIEFRDPCAMKHTKGEIPYDESYKSKEAIDLVIQRLYGGGKYQVQLRRGGYYERAWTTLVADVPVKHESQPAPPPVPERVDPMADLRNAFAVVREFKDVLGLNSRPASPPPALEPVSPAAQLNDAVSMVRTISETMKSLQPEPPPVANGEGSLGVAIVQTVGGILRDPSVTPVLGALAQWLMAMAQGKGGVPAEVLALIEMVVDQMDKNNDPLAAAQATIKFFNQYPQYQQIVAQFAQQSTTDVLINISQLKPEFAHVRKLAHAPAWIERFKQLLLAPQPFAPPAQPPTGPVAGNGNGVSTGSGSDRVETQPTPPPIGNPAAPTPPTEGELSYARLLRRCAADMASSGAVDEDVCDESIAVEETIRLISKFPEYRPDLNQLLSVPPGAVVLWLANEIQDLTLIENPGSALFARDWQSSLRSALETIESEAPTTHESETPAVVGAPDGPTLTDREPIN